MSNFLVFNILAYEAFVHTRTTLRKDMYKISKKVVLGEKIFNFY
jgi:hypothetical protein